MKKLLFFILAILLSLAACSSPAGAALSPSPSPAISVSSLPTSSASPLVSRAPSPTPAFVPDPDIPDIVWDSKKLVTSSSSEDCFDKDNRYFLSSDDEEADGDYYLYRQNKSGSAKQISTGYCSGFALYNGIVYFIEYSYTDEEGYIKNSIISYDTATNERKRVKSLKNRIHNIFCYKGKLYLRYGTEYGEEGEEQITGLYTLNADGSGFKKIKDKVSYFCIYKDTIYYITSPYYEGNSLCKCTLDGKNSETISECAYLSFTVYKDRLFYSEIIDFDKNKEYVIDLITNQKHEIGETFSSTIAGQYVLYIPYNETETDWYLNAYDFESQKTYKCLKLSGSEHSLWTFWDQVELTSMSGLDRLVIKDGKASLEKISADFDYADPDVNDASHVEYKPSEDTVIIADSEGQVYFGYSGGEWLTGSEASAYCQGNMTFNLLSLSGISGTVTSEGAVAGWGYESYKEVDGKTIYDERGGCGLKLNKPVNSWLCYINPDRFPKITPVNDYSPLLPIIQKLIDDNIGPGKLEAKINSAVEVDIDKDGKPETIINAANEEGDIEEQEDCENSILYYIVCAVRQDGSFLFLDQHYGDFFEDEEQGGTVVGIFDADGDGSYEILFDWYGYEVCNTMICKIVGNELKWVVECGWAS